MKDQTTPNPCTCSRTAHGPALLPYLTRSSCAQVRAGGDNDDCYFKPSTKCPSGIPLCTPNPSGVPSLKIARIILIQN